MTDISDTLAPKSDQQGFDDYTTGPRTFTISGVKVDKSDQPVQVELAEHPGRPFKPNKSMRRVLAKGWGPDSSAWVGKRLTLFGNPDVIYAGKAVGGVEIAAMSHLERPFSIQLTVTRGKKKPFKVDTLPDAPTPEPQPDWDSLIAQAEGEVHTLRAIWQDASKRGATPDVLDRIKNAATKAQEEA